MQEITDSSNNTIITHYILTHSERLKSYANELTCSNKDNAEDLYQETIYRCLNNADSYKHQGTAGAWIKTIMRNIHLNEVNKAYNRTTQLTDSYETSQASEDNDPCYSIDELYRAIEQLVKPEQEIIVMRLQGYSYEEIADATHKRVGTIKSTIHRIKAHLKNILQR